MKTRKSKPQMLKADDLAARAAAENVALGRARDAALEMARRFDLAMQQPFDGKRRALIRAAESLQPEIDLLDETVYRTSKDAGGNWSISRHEEDHDPRVWNEKVGSTLHRQGERECAAAEAKFDVWADKHLAASRFSIVHIPPAGRELDDVYRQVLASTEGITAAVKDVGADAEVAACQAEHTNRELARINKRIDDLTGEEFRKSVAAEVLAALDKAIEDLAERKTA